MNVETVEELENRIDELKWKSLPFFERLVWRKEQIQEKKFYTKKRLKELKWFVLSCNILLAFFAAFNIYLLVAPNISAGFQGFSLLALAAFVALRLELSMRASFLQEARFLKQLKKELK